MFLNQYFQIHILSFFGDSEAMISITKRIIPFFLLAKKITKKTNKISLIVTNFGFSYIYFARINKTIDIVN